jgi:hypothetical protein
VFRFYNTSANVHFFTLSETERDTIIATLPQFRYEGAAFFAYAEAGPELSPVFRFFNTSNNAHFYTISTAERDSIIANLKQFRYEGPVWYARTAPGEGSTPLYRFFRNANSAHFFTSSSAERDTIIASLPDFRFEGEAYFVWSSIGNFNLAAAFLNYLSANHTLTGSGPAGAYVYQQSFRGTSTEGGVPIRTYSIFSRADPLTDIEKVYYRWYNYSMDDQLISTNHFRGPFLPVGDWDAYSRVVSHQQLPQAARVGDSGPWYVAQNYYGYGSINLPPPLTTGTTTATYTVEADSNTSALLRLRETIVTLPQENGVPAVTTTTIRELVLRIGASGDATVVSDSTVVTGVNIVFE